MFLYSNSYAQVDPKKVDSLSRLIDSSAQAYKVQQESVIKYQDSAYRSEVNKPLQQHPDNLDIFLAEQERREAKERQEAMLSIVISIALFIVGVIVLLRRRKTKS